MDITLTEVLDRTPDTATLTLLFGQLKTPLPNDPLELSVEQDVLIETLPFVVIVIKLISRKKPNILSTLLRLPKTQENFFSSY